MTEFADRVALVITMPDCARCGNKHYDFGVVRFHRPVLEYTHWGTCPATLEPVLVRFYEDDEECSG